MSIVSHIGRISKLTWGGDLICDTSARLPLILFAAATSGTKRPSYSGKMPATLLAEAARKSEAVVQVCALSAGHFSLPEHQFVRPASETGRISVPALAFLVQHVDENTGKKTCLLFDLGLRRDTSQYSTPIQNHITNRQPLTTDPDVVKSLALAGLTPNDIDYVIFSHVRILASLARP